MSAQLAGHGVPVNSFSAHLALAAGVTVSIHAPSMHALRNVVARLDSAEAANDTAPVSAGNAPTPAAATVPGGSPVSQTTAPSAQAAAAAAAGDAGNAAATTATPASAQPVSGGSAASGDAGNASAGAPPAASSAQTASSEKAAESSLPADPKAAFEIVKKAFLGLSTKPAGREKCEGVLKPFGLAKLSAATPEQYPAVLAAIEKASA